MQTNLVKIEANMHQTTFNTITQFYTIKYTFVQFNSNHSLGVGIKFKKYSKIKLFFFLLSQIILIIHISGSPQFIH